MSLVVIGLNHRTAPIEVRERLTWPRAEVPGVLTSILDRGSSGAVLVSTCNRTEFYAADPDQAALTEIRRRASQRLGHPINDYAYVLHEGEVVRHLFRVAAGLDSMVLGESQVQGQVREAWEEAQAFAGPLLNRLFQSALRAGGRVRAETGLGSGTASVPSACVDLAKKIFADLSDRRALVVGAGDMAELAAGCLASEGVRSLSVTNRDEERSSRIAERLGGRAVPFGELHEAFREADLVVSSTAASQPIVTAALVAAAVKGRNGRPLCILDIAVPRDVDPEVASLENVFLYDIDDLQSVVAAAIGDRRQEIPRAERIVSQEYEFFWRWYVGLEAVGSIRALRGRIDEVRRAEVERALRRLAHLDVGDRERIEQLTRTLMNKFLHEPTVRLRAAGGTPEGGRLAEAVRHLFDLEELNVNDSASRDS